MVVQIVRRDRDTASARCAPPSQRLIMKLVGEVSITGSIGKYLTNHGGGAELREAYAACVASLASFRRMHMSVAGQYLSSTSTGTGASSFQSMLGEALDATERLQGDAVKRDAARGNTWPPPTMDSDAYFL